MLTDLQCVILLQAVVLVMKFIPEEEQMVSFLCRGSLREGKGNHKKLPPGSLREAKGTLQKTASRQFAGSEGSPKMAFL